MPNAAEIATRYDQESPVYEKKEAPVRQRLFWLAYDHLTWTATEALLPKDKSWRILDAGGGGGKFGTMMAKAGHQVTVLDISPGMVEQARLRFVEEKVDAKAKFQVGDVAALPFPDKSFDLVFCEGDPVSYCLDQYPKAMAELVRVAVPGAPVILGVDNRREHFISAFHFGDRKKAIDILRTGRSLCPYGLPVHAFTLDELHEGMEKAGAEVLEIFGKPVMFFETLEALAAERGEGFDPWEARHELLAIQEKIAHEGYAIDGQHLQVMARRKA